MNKPLVVTVLATLAILVGGVFFFGRQSSGEVSGIAAPTGYEYYWGDGCPHCKNVDDFMSTWENKDKFELQKFETWKNRDNAKRLQARSDACKIPRASQGVPLLVTPDGKCLDGDVTIIDFLKNMKFDEKTN